MFRWCQFPRVTLRVQGFDRGLWGWWCRSSSAAPTSRGLAGQGHVLPRSPEMLPAQPLERCRERDFAMARSIRRRRRGGLLPVYPTCLRVSLLQHQSDGAGWPDGRSRAAPAWRNAAFVWVSPTLIPAQVYFSSLVSGFPAASRLMCDGAVFLSHGSTAGWHWAGAGPELPASLPDLRHPWHGCRELCRVGPACSLLQLAQAGSLYRVS